MNPLVSIIVPHYQTAELAKLCLRSIRKFTTDIEHEVIVVDNASKDGTSLDYLRSVDWIRLIERTGNIPTGSDAHRSAVEIGFEAARAPFILTIHTDTIPIRSDWLNYHLDPMLVDNHIAAIGTDKLVLRSQLQEWLRFAEDTVMWWKRFRPVRVINKKPYIRSHCALYRRSALDEHSIRYNDHPDLTAGQGVQRDMASCGHECRLLDPRDVIQRVAHLNHATELLLPEFHAGRKLVYLWRGQYRIAKFFERKETRAILADASLDHGQKALQRAA
jgi:glycosyltransferase involved in cell wall biosynthesis